MQSPPNNEVNSNKFQTKGIGILKPRTSGRTSYTAKKSTVGLYKNKKWN
jgi:hypothetical protein